MAAAGGACRGGRLGEATLPSPSTVTKKFGYMRCLDFGLGQGATSEHTLDGSVSEEQRGPKAKARQPSGRQVFLGQSSLLRSLQIHKGYARRSRLVWPKNPLPRLYLNFFVTVLGRRH